MESTNELCSILQAILSGQNDVIQEAQARYLALLNQNHFQLILSHFHIISATFDTPDQIKNLTLVLLGNVISLLMNNKIVLTERESTQIQTSLLALFQNDNFSAYHFKIISNNIYKAAKYFGIDRWAQLPEILLHIMLRGDTNPDIASAVTDCFAECISSKIIDPRPFSEQLYTFIHNSMVYQNTNMKISSIFRLLYSILESDILLSQFANFVPFLELIPNFAVNSQSDPQIIQDLYCFASDKFALFLNYIPQYCNMIFAILSEENKFVFSSGTRNTTFFLLLNFISNFSTKFNEKKLFLFDLFVSFLPNLESSVDGLNYLSEIYGGNVDFALKVYSFIENNPQNPFSYLTFGSCFNGIKDHFFSEVFTAEILDLFIQGFTCSNNDFTRYNAFKYFLPIIQVFAKYNIDFSPERAISITMSIISVENSFLVLYEELSVLEKLLKFHSECFEQVIPGIVQLLNEKLLFFCNSNYSNNFVLENNFYFFDSNLENININSIKKKLITCFKRISLFYKTEFIDFSQVVLDVVINHVKNPLYEREMFFHCMKNLPSFAYSIPNDIFNEMLHFSLSFILSVNFDDDLIDDERIQIGQFLIKCVEYIEGMPEIIQKVVELSFHIASTEPNFIEIEQDFNPSMYKDHFMFQYEKKVVAISYSQVKEINKALQTLYLIFSRNAQLCLNYLPNLNELVLKLLCSELKMPFPDLISLEYLLAPMVTNYEDLLKLYNLNYQIILHNCEDVKNICLITKVLIFISECLYEKFGQQPSKFEEININSALFLLKIVEKITQTQKEKAAQLGDNAYCDFDSQKEYVNCALLLRCSLKFPLKNGASILPTLLRVIAEHQQISESSKTFTAIVFSDIIKYNIQTDPSFYESTFELFRNGLYSSNEEVCYESIYGMAVIINPDQINNDQMLASLIEMILSCKIKSKESKQMLFFAILNIVVKFGHIFNMGHCIQILWQNFPTNPYLPNHVREYYAEALAFFLGNYGNTIPNDKVEYLKEQIVYLLEKKQISMSVRSNLNFILTGLTGK